MTDPSDIQQLQETYSRENLNKISAAIIDAYRNKQYAYIYGLASQLDVDADESVSVNRLFAKLLMRFHPDRFQYYQNEIRKSGLENDRHRLTDFFKIHIALNHLNPVRFETFSEIAQEFEYGLDDDDLASLHIFDEMDGETEFDLDEEPPVRPPSDFFSALKEKEYGNLPVSYETVDFSHLEGELNLSGYQIHDLSGVELCQGLVRLDLSNNQISDLSDMRLLSLLEELDLSMNRITAIEPLAHLASLKTLDLSFNRIKDVLPLLQCGSLKYVNLLGNPVAGADLAILKKEGIVVVH